MTDGLVVDANILSDYFAESLGGAGMTYDLISDACGNMGLVINKKIEDEWTKICGPGKRHQFFQAWLEDGFKTGRVKYSEKTNLRPNIIDCIHDKYGLPRNEKDIEYVKVAHMTKIKIIVSRDIHLYDPKAKRLTSDCQQRIKETRSGRLNKYLYKTLKIQVGLACHCAEFLKSCKDEV